MTTEAFLIELAKVAGTMLGAWLAVRVELRWLRADVDRHEKQFGAHDSRIHALETKE